MNRTLINRVKDTIRHPYAWPGGYPQYLVTTDGAALCCACGCERWQNIIRAMRQNLRDGWQVDGVGINWDDADLYCDHCSRPIESAYGD